MGKNYSYGIMMMFEKQFFLLLISAFLFHVKGDFVLPSDYQKCNISDPNFNACAKVSLGKLVSMGIKGIPSLGIKPLDPVTLKSACFHSAGGSPITMELEMKNVTFYGFSNLKVISVNGTDLKKNVIQMRGIIPQARIVANYTSSGSILSIPISGFGVVEVFLYNFTIDYQTYHCPVKKNNKTYLTVRNITLDTDMERGEVIYSSDPSSSSLGLSNVDINTAINENLKAIYEEYKPTVNELVISVISPKVVRFNNEVPFEDLFVK